MDRGVPTPYAITTCATQYYFHLLRFWGQSGGIVSIIFSIYNVLDFFDIREEVLDELKRLGSREAGWSKSG
jgi:hypothetical protein